MCYDHACTHCTRTLYTPVQEKLVESLEVGVSSGDLRAKLFRLDEILHMAEDNSLLLGNRINGDSVNLQT